MAKVTRREEEDPANLNSTASSHPKRYAGTNGIECIDAIHAALGDDGFTSFCVGQCFRYLWRYRNKNGSNDLHKASDYLRWATETQEKIEGNGTSNDDADSEPDKFVSHETQDDIWNTPVSDEPVSEMNDADVIDTLVDDIFTDDFEDEYLAPSDDEISTKAKDTQQDVNQKQAHSGTAQQQTEKHPQKQQNGKQAKQPQSQKNKQKQQPKSNSQPQKENAQQPQKKGKQQPQSQKNKQPNNQQPSQQPKRQKHNQGNGLIFAD